MQLSEVNSNKLFATRLAPKPPDQAPLSHREVRFRFPDDPIHHDELTLKLITYLNKQLAPAQGKSFTSTELKNLEKMAREWMNSRRDPLTNEKWNIDDRDTSRIILNALCNTWAIKQVVAEQQQDELSGMKALAEFSLQYLLSDGVTFSDGGELQILSEWSINDLTYWYTAQTYKNLEVSLKELSSSAESSADKNKIILSIALLGKLFGYLKDSNPQSAQFKATLAQYLPGELPKIITEAIGSPKGATDSRRLQQLKGYWHAVFVQSLTATNHLHSDSNPLSPADQHLARQSLQSDGRSAPTRSGAERQANYASARSDSRGQSQSLLAEFDRQQYKLEQQARRSKSQLINYTNEMICAYNPSHRSIDYNGVVGGVWEVLAQKSEKIFDTFLKEARDKDKNVARAERRQPPFSQLADALEQILKQGNGIYVLDPAKLFGAQFYTLPAIERCGLILFSALTVSRNTRSKVLAVKLISENFQQSLASYSDVPSVSPSDPADQSQDIDIDTTVIFSARTELKRWSPADGIISSYSSEVYDEIEAKHALLTAFKDVLKDRDLPTKFVLLLAAELGLFFATIFLLAGNYPVAALSLLTQSLSFLPGYQYLRSVFAYSKTKEELSEIQLLGSTLAEALEKIESKHKKRVLNIKTAFVTMLLLTVLLSNYVYHIDESLFESDQFSTFEGLPALPYGSHQANELEQFQIPDQLSPESLRSTASVLRGQLHHLPEGSAGTSGEVIGFQPRGLLRPDGREYQDVDIHPFSSFQRVEEIGAQTHTSQADELVYEPEQRTETIYPIKGYHIVKVYQVGGSDPQVGRLGAVMYETIPDQILLVLKKSGRQLIIQSGEVMHIAEVGVEPYSPWNNWDEKRIDALALNQELGGEGGDPGLQALHRNMISEVDILVTEYNLGRLDFQIMAERYSQIAIVNSVRFADWVNGRYVVNGKESLTPEQGRYYSLAFQLPQIESQFGVLKSVADQPTAGYYCSVGNIAFQDFMRSIDIHVLAEIGDFLRTYEDRLYSRFGHLDSIVMLPTGAVLYADMTPQRPQPDEDLSALNEVPPHSREMVLAERVKELLKSIITIAIALGGVQGVTLLGKEVIRRNRRSIEEKLSEHLPVDNVEKQLVLTQAQQILFYVHELSTGKETMTGNRFYRTKEEVLCRLAVEAVEYFRRGSPGTQLEGELRSIFTGVYYRLRILSASARSSRDKTGEESEDQKKFLQGIQHNNRATFVSMLNQVIQDLDEYSTQHFKGENNQSSSEVDDRVNRCVKALSLTLQLLCRAGK